MLKVADFGTSRFLEIAAHGTTVIGSPPYMAPEQFHGKAVFASDVYSLGVTMYQMLTGMLPYDTPSPQDLEKLMRGDFVAPPRTKNSKIPKSLNDIIMKAMSPNIHSRYQRASELLEEVLAARSSTSIRRTPRPSGMLGQSDSGGSEEIQTRLKARETPLAPKFCCTAASHCTRAPIAAPSAENRNSERLIFRPLVTGKFPSVYQLFLIVRSRVSAYCDCRRVLGLLRSGAAGYHAAPGGLNHLAFVRQQGVPT